MLKFIIYKKGDNARSQPYDPGPDLPNDNARSRPYDPGPDEHMNVD